ERMSTRFSILYLLSSILVSTGCCPKPRIETHPRYTGPTLSLAELVQQVNQNNGRIKTLWASGTFECTVRDSNGKDEDISGDKLLLMYRKPGELHMAGQKLGAGRLFDIGSNGEQFWMWIPWEKIDTLWWGELRNAAHVDPAAIPVRPDLLVEVLGVSDLDPELL